MFRMSTLANLIALAVSALVATGSADAHFGARGGGGGGRIGAGGLAQRARQGGNGNAGGYNRPAPQPVAPPVVQYKQPVVTPSVKPATPIASTPNSTAVASSPAKPAPATAPAPAPAPAAVATAVAAPVATPAQPVVAAEPVAIQQPAAEIAPVEVVKKEALPQIPVGATVTLNGKDLTDKVGQVVLQVGEIALPVTIKEWKNDSVICTLPVLGLTKSSPATLHVLKADGKTASTLNLELVTALPAANPSFDTAQFDR